MWALAQIVKTLGCRGRLALRPLARRELTAWHRLGDIQIKVANTILVWRTLTASCGSKKDESHSDVYTLHGHRQVASDFPENNTGIDVQKPWYLSEEYEYNANTIKPDSPKPDLPADSPACLAWVVDQLYQELSVKDLLLIDLRNREPSSPWGPEAFMVIGTVKSERHLRAVGTALRHDLKNEFNLSIDIEGIPTERKCIIERRRRRKKLAKRALALGEHFETLQWACIEIEPYPIIVQLFTEIGRETFKIEELWQIPDNLAYSGSSSTRQPSKCPSGSRSFSTLANRGSAHRTNYGLEKPDSFQMTEVVDRIVDLIRYSDRPFETYNHDVKSCIKHTSSQGDVKLTAKLCNYLDKSMNIDSSWYVLHAHISKLRQALPEHALYDLLPLNEGETSEFLQSFFNSFPSNASAAHWWQRLLFHFEINRINHTIFSLKKIKQLLQSMLSHGHTISQSEGVEMLNYINRSPEFRNPKLEVADATVGRRYYHERMTLSAYIIELFDNLGLVDLGDERLYFALYEGCCQVLPAAEEVIADARPQIHKRAPYLHFHAFEIEDIMTKAQIRLSVPMWTRIMISLAESAQWRAFWRRWNEVAYSSLQRNGYMYTLMWALVARSGRCIEANIALRKQWAGMLTERIELTPELIGAVRTCLEIVQATPDGEHGYIIRELQNYESV